MEKMNLNHNISLIQTLNDQIDLREIYKIRMNEFCDTFMNRSSYFVTNLNISRPACSISPINGTQASDPSTINQQFPLIVSNENDQRAFQNESGMNFANSYSPMVNSITKNRYTTSFKNISQDSGCYSYENSMLANSLSLSNNEIQPKILNKHLLLDVPKGQIHFQSTPNKQLLDLNQQNDSLTSSLVNNQPKRTTKSNTKINFHSIIDLAKSASNQQECFSQKLDEDENGVPKNPNQIIDSSNLKANDETRDLSFNEKLKRMSASLINNKENNHEFIYKGKRKPRTQINKQQKEILEYAYKLKCYPDSNEVEYLCNILGFEENVIRIWFQNKRARDKLRH